MSRANPLSRTGAGDKPQTSAVRMTARAEKPVVLITGAGRRIGREIARDFAAHGWQIGIHYRQSREAAQEIVEEIESRGGNAAAFQADLSERTEIFALFPACCAALGPVSCLVNNASEFLFDSVATMTDESWTTHLDVNLKAPVFLAQAMARNLPDDLQGNVINIIDQRVWNLTPEFFSYTVSKAGLWSATRMLAQALAPRIRVNAIGPGPVLQSVHQSREDFEQECASTLLGRATSPEEIADAIRFILAAPSLTGQMLALDGGQHLAWQDGQGPSSPPGSAISTTST
jgi:NAD(P)-dependent dehydrogenase (short-subunit alcohol dehydrogenase family)